MSNFVNNIPEIIDNSDSLFGVFALVAIILAFVVFILFRNADTKQKERIFIYSTLFFLALVFSALTAGIFSGFERGSEIITDQVEQDPSVVKLLPETGQKLETFISSKGQAATEESKAQILEEALDAYINPPEPSVPQPGNLFRSPLTQNPSAQSPDSTIQVKDVKGFIFELQGCIRTSEAILKCAFFIANKEKDRELRLYGNSRIKSRIIDPNGNQYIVSNVMFGSDKKPFSVSMNLVQDVGVKAEIEFEEVPAEIGQLALVELSSYTQDAGNFTVQFRDVFISS